MKCPYCKESIETLQIIDDSVGYGDNSTEISKRACICPKCETIVSVISFD